MEIMKTRFESNMHRHEGVTWDMYTEMLKDKASVVLAMEEAQGQPDLVVYEGEYYVVDMFDEVPKSRVSITYDQAGEDMRIKKKIFPNGNAVSMAQKLGVDMVDEALYFFIQSLDDLDTKTSIWLKTDDDFRKKGGALTGEKRYGRTFIYTNGAQSFYGSRGYRGVIKL